MRHRNTPSCRDSLKLLAHHGCREMIATGGGGGGKSLYIATCDVEMTNINNYDTMAQETKNNE